MMIDVACVEGEAALWRSSNFRYCGCGGVSLILSMIVIDGERERDWEEGAALKTDESEDSMTVTCQARRARAFRKIDRQTLLWMELKGGRCEQLFEVFLVVCGVREAAVQAATLIRRRPPCPLWPAAKTFRVLCVPAPDCCNPQGAPENSCAGGESGRGDLTLTSTNNNNNNECC